MNIKVNCIILVIFLALFLSACGGIKQKPLNRSANLSGINEIPTSCRDYQGKFKPVTHILSKGGYNSEPKSYQPIIDSKGFIAEDFNGDKLTDYIFIERAKKDIQMILCMSDKNRLSRKITPFKVHETIEPDFQTISESIQFSGKVLILSINKHEHNWGSDSEISTYTYSSAYKDFILETQETTSTSGDGLRSDTFEFYDLKNRHYKIMNTCGSLEEGCKPFNRSGQIIFAKKASTLLKPSKIYRKLKAN
jgi:hypothetical protein